MLARKRIVQASKLSGSKKEAGVLEVEDDYQMGWSLPTEITLYILSFLNMKALCVMDQVTSWLHPLCCVDELWEPLIFNPHSPVYNLCFAPISKDTIDPAKT